MNLPRKLDAIPMSTSQHRRDAEVEAWICSRLNLRDLFAGATSREIRRDRLKVVLMERGLTESTAGSHDHKKPVSWRQLYKQLFDDELTTKGE